jgi:hypothetical protein
VVAVLLVGLRKGSLIMADPEEEPAASDPAEESGSASSAVGVTSAAILAAIAMDKAEAHPMKKLT